MEVNISIEVETPQDRPPAWLSGVSEAAKHFNQQTDPFGGVHTPEQQPPGPQTTYVLPYQMWHNISNPEEVVPQSTLEEQQNVPQPVEPAVVEPTNQDVVEPVESAPVASQEAPPSDQGSSSESSTSGTTTEPVVQSEPVPAPVDVLPTPAPIPEPAPEPETEQAQAPEPSPAEYPDTTEAQPAEPLPTQDAPLKEAPRPDFPPLLEGIWYASIAMAAKDGFIVPDYTFWEGYREDGGLNFGYDETVTSDSGAFGAIFGADTNVAIFGGSFGTNLESDPCVGPATFSKSGTDSITIDIGAGNNNQTIVKKHMLPVDYEPSRDGSGPTTHPSEQWDAAMAVISMSSDQDPQAVTLPVTWWIMASRVQGKVLGLLCAGTVSNAATSITFDVPGESAIALLTMTNCPGSIVPHQILQSFGTVDDITEKKQLKLIVTPLLPGPWPATKTPQRIAYAEIIKPKTFSV